MSSNSVPVPRSFFLPLGAVVGFQIGTVAAALAMEHSPGGLVLAGLAAFLVGASVQLVRVRRRSGRGLAECSGIVLGGEPWASVSYGLALGGAVWSASAQLWWLVVLCAAAGGTGCALAGHLALGRLRAGPTARPASAARLALAGAPGVAGVVLLVWLH